MRCDARKPITGAIPCNARIRPFDATEDRIMTAADTETGRRKLAWARAHMPIHARLRERFAGERPFAGLTLAICSHVEAKTGVFIETAAAGGAEVAFTGSEPMTSQDDVIAALNEQPGITGYMQRGADASTFEGFHRQVIEHGPHFILDDAAELTARLVSERPELAANLLGTCEQTTSGVQRLTAMAEEGRLTFPAYAVNDTPMKHHFDNVHGTGESTLTNLTLVTNLLLAGKTVVIAGFGYCGRGLAEKAQGWNANVIVTEVDPRRALEAHMAGFRVMPMADAARLGDCFITATGNREVLRPEHFEQMPDGAVVANAGHFDIEIDTAGLSELATDHDEVRPGINAYRLDDGRSIYMIAQGHLVNLAAPTSMGHPAEVMDQTFGTQLMAARDLLARRDELAPAVYPVPDNVDREVAEIKLDTLGVTIDGLTQRQRALASAWRYEEIKD